MTLFSPSPFRSRCTSNGSSFVGGKISRFRPTWSVSWWFLLAAGSLFAADPQPAAVFESNLQFRAGIDSNPLAMNSAAAATAGSEDIFIYSTGLGASLTLPTSVPASRTLKLNYAGDVFRFDGLSTENFSTHRLGFNGQIIAGSWKLTGEGSTLFVDGSRDTLPSVAAVNANAITLWRERRRQWQHRLKVQAQANRGNSLIRVTGTLLAYDYQTHAVSGKVPFADRSDVMGAIDLGWKQSAKSLWFSGVRVGHQNQAIVPLPNCEFDYSNDYQRLVVGWEGKPSANTTVAISGGPDFRHYSGAIDPRVFLGGRDRSSFWFEGNFSAKPCARLTITGKAGRMAWLSSTGKSAYMDSSAETAAVWTVTPVWSLRVSAKVHRCDYFPAIRDDWESLLGVGVMLKTTDRTLLSLEFLHHRGWDNLPTSTGREFLRETVNLGATIKL